MALGNDAATDRDAGEVPPAPAASLPRARHAGRVAVIEKMVLTPAPARSSPSGTTSELRHQAMADGMRTLQQGGLSRDGVTTLEEVLRVCISD
jgi:type II secretory ATPase GspE/PulE/Tfp pilus assembly ATPase PilB-like protein